MAVERKRLYLEKSYHAGLFAVFGTILFIATVLLINGDHKVLSQIAVALWTVGPPLWFFFEYFYHFPKYGNPEAGDGDLKAAQDVTAKVWAGFAVLLGVFYAIQYS